jgi:hypothetical protein
MEEAARVVQESSKQMAAVKAEAERQKAGALL